MVRIASAPFWAYVASRLFFTTTLRCLGALILGCAAYILVLLPVVLIWRAEMANAATIYAVGMAVATMGGTWVASLVFPAAHRQSGMLACVGLGAIYPMLVAATSDPAAPVRVMQYMYVAATSAGGSAAVLWQLAGRSPVADCRNA